MSAGAEEVELRNQKALFPAREIVNERRILKPMLAARLNPGGTHLIYPKTIKKDSNNGENFFDLEAFDLTTSKKQIISVQLPTGYETVFTRFNCFDPSGVRLSDFRRKLWVDRLLEKSKISKETEVVLYDLKARKFITTGLKGKDQLARFDNTAKYLYLSDTSAGRGGRVMKVNLSDFKSKPTSLPGWVHSPCMYSEYSTVFVLRPAPATAPQSSSGRRRRRPRLHTAGLEIWNLSTDKKIAELPVHQDNSRLDDIEAQWTLDGRYVYYLDLSGPAGSRDLEPLTRIWDVKANEAKPSITGAISVGPGPGRNTMVMARLEGRIIDGMLLHDVQKDRTISFGPKNARVIHAWGNKIIYVQPDNGTEMVYVADISPANIDPNDK
jgi:hypothetical protein